MRKVYTIGEALYEIVFANGQPSFATPGGGMLNVAVSLARKGVPVQLISELGTDHPGKILEDFLAASGVGTDYLIRYDQYPTALSLAFLDEQKRASYSFYKQFPHPRLQGPIPDFQPNDLLLFSASFGVNPDARNNLLRMVQHARQRGALILYDPNVRKRPSADAETYCKNQPKHASTDANILLQWQLENMQDADIIRGSDEDFATLLSMKEASDIIPGAIPGMTSDIIPDSPKVASPTACIAGCLNLRQDQVLIETQGARGVTLWTHGMSLHHPAPPIDPVSTIGAGDAFQAGVIHAIYSMNVTKDRLSTLDESDWEQILKPGIAFATEVCLRKENFVG